MDIHVPSIPPRHRVTQTLVEDLFYRPVDVCRVIWPDIELDWFQRVRLKRFCLTPRVIDLSGVGTGKTVVTDFLYINSRLMLMTNLGKAHSTMLLFPTGGTGRGAFVKYFDRADTMSPLFRAQLREHSVMDESKKKRGTQQLPDTFNWYFKGGGEGTMPNPSKDRGASPLKSRSVVDIVVDEAVEFDKAGDAIDREIVDRGRENVFNARHPVWANHFKVISHAEPQSHPWTARWRGMAREWLRGDPHTAGLTFSFKDWSARPTRGGKTFAEKFGVTERNNWRTKRAKGADAAELLGNYFGLVAATGAGFYGDDLLDAAVARGRAMGLTACLTAQQLVECIQAGMKKAKEEVISEPANR